MRLFLAIELPAAWREAVAEIRQRLQARLDDDHGLRFTSPERLHLTLRFLGDVEEARFTPLTTQLAAALTSVEVALELTSVGTFGSPSRPTVVWLGLAGDLAALHAVRGAIERALAAAGLEPDDRPLRPHITLARVHRPATPDQRRAITRAVAELPPPPASPFTAHHVALIRSYLGRNARYEALGRYP